MIPTQPTGDRPGQGQGYNRTRAPGSAADDPDDTDSSSDDSLQASKQTARPTRRRVLEPSSEVVTGGSQFKMMKVPTAVHSDPPRTPAGMVRPRMAVARAPGGKDDGTPGAAAPTGVELTPFTAAPIAPAADGALKGSTGLASTNELADYTKRKVAEIMARERQTQTREAGGGRTSRLSDASNESLDVDNTRHKDRHAQKKAEQSESESEEESDQEEDADQLFMMELKKERLSKQARSFPRPTPRCVFTPAPPPYTRHTIGPFGRAPRLRVGPRDRPRPSSASASRASSSASSRSSSRSWSGPARGG